MGRQPAGSALRSASPHPGSGRAGGWQPHGRWAVPAGRGRSGSSAAAWPAA